MAIATAQKKKKKEDSGDEVDPEMWMVTFGDLLSLLITFFVLLFSMATLDQQVLEDMFFSSFMGGAGALSFGHGSAVKNVQTKQIISKRQQGLREFHEFLLDKSKSDKMLTSLSGLAESLLASDVTVKKRGPSFVLAFRSEKMFEPGGVELKPSIKKALEKLGNVLRYSETEVMIEGHTDDIQISTPEYPSNWELSATRAARVMMFFINETEVGEKRLGSVGYGDTRPIVRNINDAYRVRNRRVEIIIRQAA
ncbi:Flagellar motor rotation protein MotB [hydrothermal vent metagenome]|uniref:Flagellar motor rotation protein MotB n=1 Tax=hydrothermal vent metagenome TaxID=652676 RepID=A0A3B1C458_9ZZZZ